MHPHARVPAVDPETGSATVPGAGITLARMIEAAASRLASATTIAELLDARAEADTVRGIAKQASGLARRKGHLDSVVNAANRAQVDAMKIEAAALARLADEADAAVERGELRKHGQRTPANLETGPASGAANRKSGEAASGAAHSQASGAANKEHGATEFRHGEGLPLTYEEAGLSHREVHEARRIRDAERAEPGIVERALEARFEAGHVPGRKFLRDAIIRRKNARVGTERSAIAADADDANLYQTPWVAGAVLARCLDFDTFWEPCCGPGALATALEAEGRVCAFASDLHDYTVSDDGEVNPFWERVQPVVTSFLDHDGTDLSRFTGKLGSIVTNPPYNSGLPDKMAVEALTWAKLLKVRHVAFLLRLNYLAGCSSPRNAALDAHAPARVIVFTRRLPMMHREDFEGEKSTSTMDMAWFVWDLARPDGPTVIERVDWAACLNLTEDQRKAVNAGATRADVWPDGEGG